MLNKLRREEEGFTLIELLVVVLIIGILAAIALPTFLGQQEKGQDASAKSNARNMVSHVESCFADKQDYSSCTAPTQTGLDLGTAGALPTKGKVAVTAAATGTYTIMAKSNSDKNYFAISRDANGIISRTCGTVLTTAGAAGASNNADGGSCNAGSW